MIDPLPKQVLCPGSESAPKRQRLLWQSDRIKLFEARRAKFFAGKVPNSPISAGLPQNRKGASGQSVPKMGFSDLILEKDGRCFRNLPIFVLRKNNLPLRLENEGCGLENKGQVKHQGSLC